jgi:hypothetical protein
LPRTSSAIPSAKYTSPLSPRFSNGSTASRGNESAVTGGAPAGRPVPRSPTRRSPDRRRRHPSPIHAARGTRRWRAGQRRLGQGPGEVADRVEPVVPLEGQRPLQGELGRDRHLRPAGPHPGRGRREPLGDDRVQGGTLVRARAGEHLPAGGGEGYWSARGRPAPPWPARGHVGGVPMPCPSSVRPSCASRRSSGRRRNRPAATPRPR